MQKTEEVLAMQQKDVSNYERTLRRAEEDFLRYDQQTMIEKFQLQYDSAYLYLNFLSRCHRIDRRSGTVECLAPNGDAAFAGFLSAMTIYDVLCGARKDCRLSGEYVAAHDLDGLIKGCQVAANYASDMERYFTGRCAALRAACLALNATSEPIGDFACRIPLFDFFPIVLRFWDADEEFTAALKLLWDKNTLQYMNFETTFYAAQALFERLRILGSL